MTVHVPRPLPVTAAEMRENEAFYRRSADRVNQAAAALVARGQGFGGRKAFIADVAAELGMPVARLAPMLVAWRQLGWVGISRADLGAGAYGDPSKVAASEIDDGVGRYHFIEPPAGVIANPARRRARAIANPGPDLNAPAVEVAADLYRTFHRYDPKWVGAFADDFAIPSRVVCLGLAATVLYRSGKVDPETMRKPRRPQNYIHEHDSAGVMTYAPVGYPGLEHVDAPQVAVPDWICETTSLVLLGACLGFSYRLQDDEETEIEPQVVAPLPELYTIPSGRALLVIEDKRSVAAIIWGGSLGVEARGIVG